MLSNSIMDNTVFKSNDTINSILNYKQPSFYSIIEVIYNPNVLSVLSHLDYNQPTYNGSGNRTKKDGTPDMRYKENKPNYDPYKMN